MKNNIKNIVTNYIKYYPNEDLTKLKLLIEHNIDNIQNLFNRKNFEGHITASGYIYSLEDDKLLLLEHKALNKFLQPGGHVESEDLQLIDSAKREIKEETGLSYINNIAIDADINIPFDINSHVIPKNEKKNEEEHYHHDFRYLFLVDKKEDIIIDSNESNGYKWVSIDEIINDDKYGLSIKKIKDIISNYKENNKKYIIGR